MPQQAIASSSQENPADKNKFIFDITEQNKDLLSKPGYLTMRMMEAAIQEYNRYNPHSIINISNIDKSVVHPQSYMHILSLKMTGKIMIRDLVNGRILFNKDK